MKSNVIKKRLSNLIEELKSLNKSERIKAVKLELKSLRGVYSKNYAFDVMQYYKSELAEIYPELKKALTPSKSLLDKRKKEYKRKVIKRSSVMKAVNNIDEVIEKAKDLLTSDKYTDIATGLAFLTGRRISEILKTGKFTRIGKSKDLLHFDGQLKKRGQGERFKIYTIGNSAKQCAAALKQIRQQIDTRNISIKDLNAGYYQAVCNRVVLHFGEFLGLCSLHDLRALYAAYCCYKYKPDVVNENVFIGQILGHDGDNIDVANSYKKYIIK